jgi:hypothetical protein
MKACGLQGSKHKQGTWLSERAFLLISVFFAAHNLFASEFDVQRGLSPSGAIRYVTTGEKRANVVSIGLTARPNEWVELCTVDRDHVRLTFSPDEQWLVMTTGMRDSLKNHLRLFKRRKGLAFVEMRDTDLGTDLKAMMLKQSGEKKLMNFKGTIDTTIWSTDSAAFLICVTGEADAGTENMYANPWFCVYEVATGKIGFDLSKHPFDLNVTNERAVRAVR